MPFSFDLVDWQGKFYINSLIANGEARGCMLALDNFVIDKARSKAGRLFSILLPVERYYTPILLC